MAVTSQSTILIDVDISSTEAQRQADDLGKSIATLTARNKDLAKANQKTSAEYVRNQQNIRRLSNEQRAYVSIANEATGSNNQLRSQLSLLTAQYNALSKAEREGTVAGKALQVQTRAISDELKANESKVGDNRRSVAEYTKGINESVVAQIPFTNNLTLIKDAFGALTGVISQVKEAQAAQTTATELNTAALEAQTAAEAANRRATVASISATEANTAAQVQAAEAEQLRIIADEQRLLLEQQLVLAEEREAAILAQLAAEEAAVVAEERLRVIAEEALVAAQIELVAAEEARIAAEAEVAAATTAAAAATQAAAARTVASSSGFKLAGTAIVGVFVAIGAAVFAFQKQFNDTSDYVDARLANVKAWFLEIGNVVGRAVKGEGFGAFRDFFGQLEKAADYAEKATIRFQDIEDIKDVTDVLNQQAQAEVDNLRLRARNRAASNEERQRYLAQAEKLEQESLKRTESYNKTFLDNAIDYANQYKKLTADDIKELRNGNIVRLNQLDQDKKITADAYEKLKQTLANQISARQAHNQRLERLQNDQDKYAEQEKAAAEKRQAELDKINEDRRKSELVTSQAILTTRQKELSDINADIDKRIALYRKYGQDTVQLERERQVRLNALANKYYIEDAAAVRANIAKAAQLRISLITDADERERETRELAYQQETADTDRRIASLAARIALGEQGLTELIQSEVDKRTAITAKYNYDTEQQQLELSTRLTDIERAGQEAARQAEFDDLNRQYELNNQRLQINQQLTDSYRDLVGSIGELLNKNTIAGKIAFLAQKAYAIQQIIFNAELTKSQIILRYEMLKTQAVAAAGLIPVFGPAIAAAAVGALTAAQGVEIAKATASEVVQIGIVAATAVGGFEKGGQFKSDGRGALLPGYSKKDNRNATLRDGEAVIVSEATRDPFTRQILSDINVAYGGRPFTPGYALGGVYGGSFMQSKSTDISNQIYSRNTILEAASRMRIQVAVTDINDAQSNYVKITDAGNFE